MNKAFIALFLFSAASCTMFEKNPEYLQPATGKPGNMVLIMDSVQWKGAVGDELRKIFKAEVPGLPREEPMFDVIYSYPRKGTNLLTQLRNLVFVFTLDQNTTGSMMMKRSFSPETLEKIKMDSSFFLYTARDEYSRGQEVMYLFSDTEENLIKKLRLEGKRIQRYFNDIEKRRIQTALRKTTSASEVTTFLKKENSIEIHLPFGYKLADKQNNFVWFRQVDAQVDKDVFLAWKKYESEYQLLPDSLLAWRNEIAREYLFEDPDNRDSYLVTVTDIPYKPVKATQVDFNGRFGMELRGIWKTNNNTMGGPFLSYGLVDEQKGLIYYIEGFCFSPGKDQRETIRELEAILWTFKSSDLTTSKQK
jgi:hypothetical protein